MVLIAAEIRVQSSGVEVIIFGSFLVLSDSDTSSSHSLGPLCHVEHLEIGRGAYR